MPGLESITLTVWVKVGSRWEEDKIAGLSHFLEHMVFKGSSKRPTAKTIAEAVDNMGGEINAATSKEWTNFYIKTRSGNLETAFDILSDMVLHPLLEQKEIDKEKGVILEEMAMHEDTPMFHIGDIFERLIFAGNHLGRDVIGEKEAIKSLTHADFVKYRTTHYDTDNILITVAGGMDEKEVLALAQKYFGEVKTAQKEKHSQFTPQQDKPQVLLQNKKSDQAHLILGFLGFERGNPRKYAEALLTTVLGAGMSSRLFTEVREKRGLAYSVQAEVDHYVDTGYVSAYAGVDLGKIDEAIKVIYAECLKLAKDASEISAKELTKAKEYLKGHMALSLEDTRNVNSFFAEQVLFLPKVETPEEVFAKIDAVKIEELYELAREVFVPKKANLAIIGPYEDEERFAKLLSQ
jgi:predicted Zn-dependent peptidase